jgi:hypothetical protein
MIMSSCCGWDLRLERNIKQLATPRVGTSTFAVDGFAAQACATNAQIGDCNVLFTDAFTHTNI